MRDPNRIEPLLAKLGEAWKKCPDLRFGQFIGYFFSKYGKSPFPVEDDVWMVGIQAFIDGEDVRLAMNAYEDKCIETAFNEMMACGLAEAKADKSGTAADVFEEMRNAELRRIIEVPEGIERIVQNVTATMALSGMELTEEDKDRIRKIPHMTEEEIEAEVQMLVEKHKQK